MNIKIMTFEKHKDANLRNLEDEYLKRLSKFCKVQMEAIKRGKIKNSMDEKRILEAEAKTVLEKLSQTDYLVVLDSNGKEFHSEGLSQQLKKWEQSGIQSLVFFIGGPIGIAEAFKKRANFVLSLSQLTFTHEMTRMLLCEALYRSFDILNGGSYHK